MTETTTVVDETVEGAVESVDEAPSIITDELVRDLALKLNPFVKIGESPAVNVAPNGWLADVVERAGWDEAEAKFPEVGRFLSRLRGTLEELVAGA